MCLCIWWHSFQCFRMQDIGSFSRMASPLLAHYVNTDCASVEVVFVWLNQDYCNCLFSPAVTGSLRHSLHDDFHTRSIPPVQMFISDQQSKLIIVIMTNIGQYSKMTNILGCINDQYPGLFRKERSYEHLTMTHSFSSDLNWSTFLINFYDQYFCQLFCLCSFPTNILVTP